MDIYIVTLTILGSVVLLTAWLPMVLRQLPLSLPIFCVFLGALLTWSPFALLPAFNPLESRALTEHLTEIVVIVALMGAGLKLDRKIGWRRWGTTWRLLGIAMPLTIAAIALLSHWVLGLGLASALLLAHSVLTDRAPQPDLTSAFNKTRSVSGSCGLRSTREERLRSSDCLHWRLDDAFSTVAYNGS